MPNLAEVYCPGLDTEFTRLCKNMLDGKWVDRVHAGGDRSLWSLDPTKKLYVVAHGNGAVPVCSTTAGSWTGEQLANRMWTDGLRRVHREIEVLICYAGFSVARHENLEQRMTLYGKFRHAISQGDTSSEKVYRRKLKALAANDVPLFTDGTQVLPFCAQFIDALKRLGCTNVRVTAYKGAVETTFDSTFKIRLQGRGGDDIARPDDIVRWL